MIWYIHWVTYIRCHQIFQKSCVSLNVAVCILTCNIVYCVCNVRLHHICYLIISLHCSDLRHSGTSVFYLKFIFTVRNEVAKVMFLQASVCPRGGVPDQVHPLRSRHPPGLGTPPRTRYTPLGPGTHPPGADIPLDQVHPPGPDTPPGTRYTHPQSRHPPDQVHPPGTRYNSQNQVHLPEQTPPGTRYTPPTEPGTPPEIRPLLRTVRILLECILVYFW